jgi:hypothetical protein
MNGLIIIYTCRKLSSPNDPKACPGMPKAGGIQYFASKQPVDLNIKYGHQWFLGSLSDFPPDSIRINDQWRICFRWHQGDAYDVEITDYL